MRIILVEPLYDLNVGKICRVMKNFGFKELYIVNPRAKLGFEAEKYAKHAQDVLKKAKVVKTFEEAVLGCYPVVGTTASFIKGERDLVRLKPLAKVAGEIKGKKAAIVFGREDVGLDRETLLKCDMSVYIESSEEYESLNLSNAAAVVLYMLRMNERKRDDERPPNAKLMRKAMEYTDKLVEAVKKNLQNPEKCRKAFKNILMKSNADEGEIRSIMCVMKRLLDEK
jgi:tRNA/rRNA methyltransferase